MTSGSFLSRHSSSSSNADASGTIYGRSVPDAIRLKEWSEWDGKSLRGTRDGETRAQQILVRMQLALKRLVSSQVIPPETNEAGTTCQLVKNLLLKGKLIVGDAAHCQREFCNEITDKEGDYLVTVKDNEPQLRRDVEQAFVILRSFPPTDSVRPKNCCGRQRLWRKVAAASRRER